MISSHVSDEDGGKIFMGGLPPTITDGELREFVSTFGPLKGFNLVKDLVTGASKGYAFFSYRDLSVTEAAVKGLHGITLQGHVIQVQTAANSSNLEKAQLDLDSLAQKEVLTQRVLMYVWLWGCVGVRGPAGYHHRADDGPHGGCGRSPYV
jgi:RNA recognition motif-containing protein